MENELPKIGESVIVQAGPYTGIPGRVESIVPDPSRKEKSVIIVRVIGHEGISVPLWPSQLSKVDGAQ